MCIMTNRAKFGTLSCTASYNKFPALIKHVYHAFKLGLSLSIMLVAKVTAWWTHYKVSHVLLCSTEIYKSAAGN